MFELGSPSVFWCCPWTVWLYSNIVPASANPYKSILSPLSSPGVLSNPVFLAIFTDIVANNFYVVFQNSISCSITINATFVGFEILRQGDSTCNRSILPNFLHHSSLSCHCSYLVHAINKIAIWNLTGLICFTRFTLDGLRTNLTVVESSCQIDRTRIVCYFIFAHPFEGVVRITTVTTLVFITARQKNLRWYDYFRPTSISLNFYSVGKNRSSSVCPVRATILGQILIFDSC